MKQPKECPQCGYNNFGQLWQRGRKLAYRCEECHWMSKPFTPPYIPIEMEREISVSYSGGIEYTVYDQYGHVMVMSRTYIDRDKAIEALKDELKKNPGSTAVLWPETVIAKGEVYQ